jgi:hypothetical protein
LRERGKGSGSAARYRAKSVAKTPEMNPSPINAVSYMAGSLSGNYHKEH